MLEFIKDNLQRNKVILINVIVTAVQGFFVAWSAAGFKADKLSLGVAVGAGASAAWNVVLKPLVKQYTALYK